MLKTVKLLTKTFLNEWSRSARKSKSSSGISTLFSFSLGIRCTSFTILFGPKGVRFPPVRQFLTALCQLFLLKQ
ncbi:MAG TPA: hypothetical protein DDE71_04065 [Tenacibaculum sp.]|nr:hypothetical protein [Tenacibaculum sp.]